MPFFTPESPAGPRWRRETVVTGIGGRAASVLAEAARILRPGGVFAAYDYDVPPVVQPEVDRAFASHLEARRAARVRPRTARDRGSQTR